MTIKLVEPGIFVAQDGYILKESLTFIEAMPAQMESEEEYLSMKEAAKDSTTTSWIMLGLFGLSKILGNYSMDAVWMMI